MSGSLLLILAVWLLLMAPLLLRKQSPVRRTSRGMSETRILHEGGAKRSRRPRRLLPAEGHYMSSDEDVDADIDFVEAEPEYVLFDEDVDARDEERASEHADIADGVETVDAEVDEDHADVVEHTADETTNLETLEGELVDADAEELDGEEHVADAQRRTVPAEAPAMSAESVTVDAELADDAADTMAHEDDKHEDAGADTPTTLRVAEAEADTADADTENEPEEQPALRTIPTAYFRGGDLHVDAGVREEGEAAEAESPLTEAEEESFELSEEDMEFIASRRGRGVYDPVASQQLYNRRLQRRKQVLGVLAGLTAIALIVSLLVGGGLWIAFLVTAALTGVYLFNLRRQAIEEAKLRRRRLARMRRARLGVRNLEDAELGVPDRLLRPGAIVVETDEADPELENLAYTNGGDFFDDGFDDYPGEDANLDNWDGPHGRAHIRAV
ncbi:hypothetical protein FYJ86_04270 [Corynebacterium urealyticum]|uniref:divisome protein SepX/GlpR n=1 Tax=Corynebacterium urealyticum TaxID=43771 RepID=UPI0011EB4A4A|nr:gephyrin-like molybdotransferase receptor GlpR [Corynebacterium urealyticum]TYT21952.1 hypothetical protein FYJ86_04270 [Corynebacterium urealyticum]